jgi:RsiW-degrading membrane proteinase PrsW (M82 family)
MALILLLVALAPGFFLLWYFWHRDRYEPEPKKKIIMTFILGAVMVIPAILIEVLLERGVNALTSGVLSTFLLAFIVVAPTEEFLKFFIVKQWVYDSSEFDEVMDGIVYMVSASLGFATLENIFYVFQHGLGIGVIRAFLAVP